MLEIIDSCIVLAVTALGLLALVSVPE